MKIALEKKPNFQFHQRKDYIFFILYCDNLTFFHEIFSRAQGLCKYLLSLKNSINNSMLYQSNIVETQFMSTSKTALLSSKKTSFFICLARVFFLEGIWCLRMALTQNTE